MALLASCCIWFGLFLRPDDVLADKWPVYVFPLNHLFLFAVGCFFAKIFLDRRPSKAHTLTQAGTLIASVAAIFSPLAMTDTATVSGVGRLIFVILSLAMCWISITLVETPKALARFLNPLGLWSYSVYLLHPFMFQGLKLIKLDSQPAIHAILTILGTLVLAKFSYQYLEKPSVDWARRKADQWFKPQTEPISDSSGK
jgi:peptidoglycan/LPS O-acetylase OafA/YrhL